MNLPYLRDAQKFRVRLVPLTEAKTYQMLPNQEPENPFYGDVAEVGKSKSGAGHDNDFPKARLGQTTANW
jgi:hypothetical protein